MNILRKYNFDETEISAICVEPATPPSLWVGFEKNSDDVCVLKKYSLLNPENIRYSMELSVDNINKIYYLSPRIYTLVIDSTIFATYRTSSSPISTAVNVSIPSGVNESAIDMVAYGTNLFLLTPGEDVENAKILRYSTTMVLQETIELTGVHDVNSLTVDSSGVIWCTTYEENSRLIKVYNDGGYTFDVINLF
jgi:hypothetical protein